MSRIGRQDATFLLIALGAFYVVGGNYPGGPHPARRAWGAQPAGGNPPAAKAARGGPVRFDPLPRGTISFAAFSPDSKILAFGRVAQLGIDTKRGRPRGENAILLCETATGREVHRLEGRPFGWVRNAVFAPGGNLLVDDYLKLWDPMNGKALYTFEIDPRGRRGNFTFSPDGKSLFVRIDPKGSQIKPYVCRFDIPSRKEARRFGHTADGAIEAFAVSDDSQYVIAEHRLVVSTEDHGPNRYTTKYRFTAHLWEVSTGKDLGPLGEATDWTRSESAPSDPTGQKLREVGAAPEGFRVRRLSHGRALVLPRYLPPPRLKVTYTPGGILHQYQSDGVTPGGVIRLLDAATGKERHRLTEFQGGYISEVVLSPDGNRLAAIGQFDSNGKWSKFYTLLLWDVSRWQAAAAPPPPPSAEDLKRLWADLARPDPAAANRAMAALAASPAQAVALFRERLRPLRQGLDQAPKLIADLDSAEYDTRQQASRKLKALDDLAEPLLRQALQERPSAEVRRRINDILESLNGPLPPEHLRYWRSVDVLEHLATPQARQVLEGLGLTTGGRK